MFYTLKSLLNIQDTYEGSYRETSMRGGERVYVGTLFRRIVLARQKVAYPPWNSILFQGKFFRSEKFDLSMDLARFPEKKRISWDMGFAYMAKPKGPPQINVHL